MPCFHTQRRCKVLSQFQVFCLDLFSCYFLRLDQEKVLNLMKTEEFPFAHAIAVAYDIDTEFNWAETIYTQSVVILIECLLGCLRPITSNSWDAVIGMYKSSAPYEDHSKKMHQFLKIQDRKRTWIPWPKRSNKGAKSCYFRMVRESFDGREDAYSGNKKETKIETGEKKIELKVV